MENRQEVLTITRTDWSDEAAECIGGKVPHVPAERARQIVEAGGALFQVKAGESLVGYYILTIDGREGVFYLGVGTAPGMDLTASLVPIIEKQFQGLDAIRIHTRRPGLVKKLASMGYEPEMVLRKAL